MMGREIARNMLSTRIKFGNYCVCWYLLQNHVRDLCGQNAVFFNVKAGSQPVSLCGNLCAVNRLRLTEYRNFFPLNQQSDY
jgi:hypothetical protein